MESLVEIKRKIATTGFTIGRSPVPLNPKREITLQVKVPGAKAGALTTRDNASEGEITMDSDDHGISTGDRLDIYWTGGSRRAVVAGTVEVGSVIIPISTGSGDNLPVADTEVKVSVPVERDFYLEGFRTSIIAIEALQQQTVVLADGSDAELWSIVFPRKELYLYNGDPVPNPLLEVVAEKVFLSHSDLKSKVLVLYFAQEDISSPLDVNDPPTITVPSTQTTNEDTNKTITGLEIVDEDEDDQTVTLSVSSGGLTLASTTGLTFASGDGTNDASMEFSGSFANVNAALDGMTFVPPSNYSGTATITIETSDGENDPVSDTFNVTVTPVNDAPTLSVPGTQSGTEDTNKTLPAITVADVDNPASLSVTITQTNGTFHLASTSGITFDSGSNGSASMTFHGSITNLNNALNGASVHPTADYNGAVVTSVSVSDGVASPVSSDITVNFASVNDPPVLTVPGTQSGTEDTDKNLTGFNIVDVDHTNVTVTLSSTNSTFTLATTTGLTTASGGNGTNAWSFSGTKTNCINGLNSMAVTPAANFNGAAVLTVAVSDGTDSDSDTVTINFAAANDAPVITVPSPVNTEIDSPVNITGLTIADVDGNSQTVTLSVEHGTLTLASTTGLTFVSGDGSDDVSMEFSGTVANVNAALDGIEYTPDSAYNGVDTLSIDTDDGAGGTDSDTLEITVGPVLSPLQWNSGGDSQNDGIIDANAGAAIAVSGYIAINYKDGSGTDQTAYLSQLSAGGTFRIYGDDGDVTVTTSGDGDPGAASFFFVVDTIVSGSFTSVGNPITVEFISGP